MIAAAQGCQVFTVEPTTQNLVYFYNSLLMSNLQENVTIFKNGVYSERKMISFYHDDPINLGNFKMKSENGNPGLKSESAAVQAVLLSDVVNDALSSLSPQRSPLLK